MSSRRKPETTDRQSRTPERVQGRELQKYPEKQNYRDVSESRRMEAQFREKFRTQGREIKESDKKFTGTPAEIDHKRLEAAAQEIRKNELMKPEKWKTMDPTQKKYALEANGKAMGNAYECPAPPLTVKKMEGTSTMGSHGDGYYYRPESKYADKKSGVEGSDYAITMNKEGMNPKTHEKLFGDDPRTSIKTYGHEYRHAYQCEQAQRYEKGFKVDDPVKAREWSDNLKDYKEPPDDKIYVTDRARYDRDFAAYEAQPVEQDARDFGKKLSEKVYENNT